VLSAVAGYYQTYAFAGEPSLIAVLGLLDRDATEACVQQNATLLAPGARLERDGELTRLIGKDTVGYLGWARDDTVYWSTDRATVEEAVAQRTTIATNADVMALAPHIDRKKSMWFVAAIDATSGLLDVPSTAVWFSFELTNGRKYTAQNMPRLPITVGFACPADARRAAAALHAPRKTLSPAVGGMLAQFAVNARGSELEIDVAPLFAHLELIDEVRAALERTVAQQKRDGRPRSGSACGTPARPP
jgi:hypothetical protein